MRLDKKFFEQDTLIVSKKLLGQIFCRQLPDGRIFKGKIVETEAYTQEEPSCHAYCGKTKRSQTLFEVGGTFYVYFTYGMYYCSNIVTEKEGYGSATLIRAVEPLTELNEYKKTDGPAKFCKAFDITTELNGIDITQKNSAVWIEKDEDIDEKNIIQTTRIGITKATDLPWRFYIKDNKFISKK